MGPVQYVAQSGGEFLWWIIDRRIGILNRAPKFQIDRFPGFDRPRLDCDVLSNVVMRNIEIAIGDHVWVEDEPEFAEEIEAVGMSTHCAHRPPGNAALKPGQTVNVSRELSRSISPQQSCFDTF